ncbi:MAG: TetR family transcriptional regulator [Pseudomonadales bacterium]
MARYSREHKAQSRQRLIEAAASLFRKRGYDGVGVDELCGAAGLTRGAFYGHFDSKAELLSAVLGGAHDFVRRLRARTATTYKGLRRQAVDIAQDYLAPGNRRAVISGCSIAALAIDAARGDDRAQKEYAQAVSAVLEEMDRLGDNSAAAGNRDAARDPDAARAALALCVGGLLIDNACGKNRIGQQVARAAQKEVARLLA